jgi:hypothetical protein
MASGNVANGECHSHHRQAKRQCYTHESNAHLGKCGRHNGSATPAKNQPERAEKLGAQSFHQ